MKRKIITIDEEKCDGCGLCIPDCPEGALQVIDSQARLISDLFCDGLGACIGSCPKGAIAIEEREAEPYDEKKVMENITKQGPNVIRAHLDHLRDHNEEGLLIEAIDFLKERNIFTSELSEYMNNTTKTNHEAVSNGCPGARQKDMRRSGPEVGDNNIQMSSALRNWPIQLRLINPRASYFENADLLVVADCVPFAYAGFHSRFLQDKIMITFCPKLDNDLNEYIEKLAVIFNKKRINSISVAHMEVPCCLGILSIIQKALARAEIVIPIKEYIISIAGNII